LEKKKFSMQEKRIVDLSSQLTLAISLVKTTFWKENLVLDTNAKLNILTTCSPQIKLVNCS
jgi:hypothetical protein